MTYQLWLLIILCCAFQAARALYCDRIYQSVVLDSVQKNASYKFEAPTRMAVKPWKIFKNKDGNLFVGKNFNPSPNPGKLNDSQKSTKRQASPRAMHCIYKFVAGEDEKVALSFTSFKLRGDDETECSREYMDIFVTFKQDDNLAAAIGQEQPNGRFCGTVVPRRVVSLHNMIVLSIYTELDLPIDNKPLFSGAYEFFKHKTWDQIGPPLEGTLCTHNIYSSQKREGEFQSITYPGSYVKDLSCSYKFIGEPNERIRLEFLDLDLYSGGSHCPLDSVKIFDGLDESSESMIQTICGSHRSLVIYSTLENMLVTFTTLKREVEIQNRGFSAYFEFSDKFFNPNFISGSNAKHIRGSECDQRIVSSKRTEGSIVSPDNKNNPKAICRYIFEGLQNIYDYEKVLIKFTEFDLKTQKIFAPESSTTTPITTTTTPSTSTAIINQLLFDQPVFSNNSTVSANQLQLSSGQSNSTTNLSSDQICPDNYVRLYTDEQKPDQKQDPNDYDYVFCSNELPPTVESDSSSLLMEYNSGTIGGQFKAEYKFIIDFRIPGQQLGSGCNYVYKSDIIRNGTFNSPHHPSYYINDMNCIYTFLTKSDEALLLQFTNFKMNYSTSERVIGFNDACKGEDSIDIHELILDSSERVILNLIPIGTYCNFTAPGPILSFRPVRVNLRTNKEGLHYGFSAMYNFHQIRELETNEFVTNCGEQINARLSMQRSGTISSPPTYQPAKYEKRNHICSWNITVRPTHRIQLDFDSFDLEGNPTTRGCAVASVRLESNPSKGPIEMCGEMSLDSDQPRTKMLNDEIVKLDTKKLDNETARPDAKIPVARYISDGDWLLITFISTKRASGASGFKAIWTEIKKNS